MYYTETVIYLLWEGDKRTAYGNSRSRSPLTKTREFIRSRSPSPSSSPESTRRTPFTTRKPRQYISYDSLKVIYDFEESLKNWCEVSEQYITDSLNISFSIPYKILAIFLKDDSKIVFKVVAYELNLDTITTKILNSMTLSIPIIDVSCMDKYVSEPNTANIRVNLSLSHIPIFSLLGRDNFSFSITVGELEQSTKKCFDAFRNLCRSDKVLMELFEKSITQYFDSSREQTGVIIREFLDSQK